LLFSSSKDKVLQGPYDASSCSLDLSLG